MSIQQVEEVAGEQAPVPSARAAELARLSPSRAALELAWPGIIEQSVSALGTAAVFAFVGHLGATATAAVGAAGQFLFLLFPVWRSLAIGTIAVVSRRMGEGRTTEAADATRQSLILGALAGLIFGVGFVIFAAPLLRLLGAADDVVAIGAPFLAVIGATSGTATVALIGTSAMRAAGDTRTPMFLALASVVLSVALAYYLIDVLGIGPMGSAYASSIVWILNVIVVVVLLIRGVAGLSIAGGPWRLSRQTTRTLFAISLPSGLESATFSFGMVWATAAGITFLVLPSLLLGIFTISSAVVMAGIGALAVVGIGQPAQAVIFALGGALRGAGDTRYPLVVSLVNWFVVRLPLAYAFAFVFGLGLTGIWLGVTIDYFVRAALLALRFRSGAWARVRV